MSPFPMTLAVIRLMHKLDHPAPSAGAVLLLAAAENQLREIRAQMLANLEANRFEYVGGDV